MKMKSLQMKGMILPILLTLLLNVAAMTNALAQDQVATLQHNGEISVFYGGNAFVDAYNAAENGDVITLSVGNFQWCDIIKCIIIHGAGARQDEMVNERTQTVFLGEHSINCFGSETEHLIVEGVYFSDKVKYNDMYYAEFFRCNFSNIYRLGSMSGSKFINCRIGSMAVYPSVNVYLFNSIVFSLSSIHAYQPTEANVIAYNSFIALSNQNQAESSIFYNCVVAGNTYYAPGSNCTFINTVMVKNGFPGSLLQSAFNRDCLEVDELSQVFVDYTGDFNNEQFILQDEITNSIQGNDGTEVGIYGGMYPFTDRPVYMIMRHCTVGNRTTDDGHLSVDIEVVTEE